MAVCFSILTRTKKYMKIFKRKRKKDARLKITEDKQEIEINIVLELI